VTRAGAGASGPSNGGEHEVVTVFRPDEKPADSGGVSTALPADLLEQVRGRVRLLSLLLLSAFVFDPLYHWGRLLYARLADRPPGSDVFAGQGFLILNLVGIVASSALWWAAGSRRVSASSLHTLGLAYEVVICFMIALATFWQFYIEHGILPNLTWVPAVVILFPLILPGPPRRMLVAAVIAGGMAPLTLLLLDLTGKITNAGDAYGAAIVSSGFAIAFASMGARVVYRLGREVATAREMGSYRLEEKLGQGGMGEVWRARHRMLARPAAIKLIRPALRGHTHPGLLEEAQRRFEREAQAIARLRSPHTVDLFDFGVASDGAFYYVMELLDGLDADKLVRRFGAVPAERAIHLLRQVCHSLSEADSHGLVHRDIKPANIFLCRYGEELDFVKVLDFGLVKALGDAADGEEGLTLDHVVRGTPAFIAPEQALGRTGLDGRADIYSTGCVAFWLLTGHHVFSAETPMELMMHHARTAPVPPSKRSELPIPPALDQIVLSCLEKDPGARPQSARELSRLLERVETQAPWTEERARQWWAAHQPAPPSSY
jgi:serine/threonine-protein kinase